MLVNYEPFCCFPKCLKKPVNWTDQQEKRRQRQSGPAGLCTPRPPYCLRLSRASHVETRGPGALLPGELAHTHRGSVLPPPWALAPSSAPIRSLPLMLACICPSPPRTTSSLRTDCVLFGLISQRECSARLAEVHGHSRIAHKAWRHLVQTHPSACLSLSFPAQTLQPAKLSIFGTWFSLSSPSKLPLCPYSLLFLLPGAQSQACRALHSARGIHHQTLCPPVVGCGMSGRVSETLSHLPGTRGHSLPF